MTVHRLNPGNEEQMYEQMTKICAVLVMKMGGSVEISTSDFAELLAMFPGDIPTLITQTHEYSFELSLVSTTDGKRLAREAGGLPQ
ncbi:hypothetical protein WKR88_17955 [Trinickia caryophylli]|uniref:Uncharacterized protein n=1 Tax=Trinickia caryophylli TaxID=28094 RepID=A0A1X7DZ03_TRICW|nr:hypothetical protein [Trinickia caryophylli]PMS14126.1 hypothetical protein C0Z17_00875 [Trinickia caryophylli]TRX17825.1 hypothetical protein FNF07_06015 [Trinickia caryophylli]WQE11407.1 hypothetical protein U0034_16895 [Trinickia caryophylli]SMF24192.1 hypothetical protein SAMN06295900_104263 [Trinickia caryophylli]GLU32569.1 hypothetical protein Busp01_24110 [Trinickia caryophylli]